MSDLVVGSGEQIKNVCGSTEAISFGLVDTCCQRFFFELSIEVKDFFRLRAAVGSLIIPVIHLSNSLPFFLFF